MDSPRDANDAVFADPTRRTHLAQERTLLAWWRTAFGTVGLTIAVGSLLPKLTNHPRAPFLWLSGGYAILSIWFVLLGAYRQRANEHAMAHRGFVELKQGMLTALAVYMTALVVATCCVLFWSYG